MRGNKQPLRLGMVAWSTSMSSTELAQPFAEFEMLP
jgi:hypothetical protein